MSSGLDLPGFEYGVGCVDRVTQLLLSVAKLSSPDIWENVYKPLFQNQAKHSHEIAKMDLALKQIMVQTSCGALPTLVIPTYLEPVYFSSSNTTGQ